MPVKNKHGQIITHQQFFKKWEDCEKRLPEVAASHDACFHLGITYDQACDLMGEAGEEQNGK